MRQPEAQRLRYRAYCQDPVASAPRVPAWLQAALISSADPRSELLRTASTAPTLALRPAGSASRTRDAKAPTVLPRPSTFCWARTTP